MPREQQRGQLQTSERRRVCVQQRELLPVPQECRRWVKGSFEVPVFRDFGRSDPSACNQGPKLLSPRGDNPRVTRCHVSYAATSRALAPERLWSCPEHKKQRVR